MDNHTGSGINNTDQERSLKDLSVNTASVLCYVGVWVSGIIILILEQKNRFIRFHALQSIITFGALFIAGSILGRFPVAGAWLSGAVSLLGFILWIILMVKAGQGELFKLPWVGDFAERLAEDTLPKRPEAPGSESQNQTHQAAASNQTTASSQTVTPGQAAAFNAEKPEARNPESPAGADSAAIAGGAVPMESREPLQSRSESGYAGPQYKEPEYAEPIIVEPPPARRAEQAGRPKKGRARSAEEFREKYYSYKSHTGRVVGSAFAIAWSIVLIIFFNYFSQYIAYYHPVTSGPNAVWEVFPLVTADFAAWLPIVTLALVVTIIGHAVMIAYDRYIAREIIQIVIDIFSLAAVISLVSIFPFDFSPIPNTAVVHGLEIGLPIFLIVLAVCIGIGILVKFITMVVHLAENKY